MDDTGAAAFAALEAIQSGAWDRYLMRLRAAIDVRRRTDEFVRHIVAGPPLTPSADVPACRDEDPATAAVLAAAYPDPPEYQHPEDS